MLVYNEPFAAPYRTETILTDDNRKASNHRNCGNGDNEFISKASSNQRQILLRMYLIVMYMNMAVQKDI